MKTHQAYRFPFASYPAARLALLFAAGIATDYYTDEKPLEWFSLLGLFILLYALSERTHRRTLKTWSYHLAIGCYLCSTVCFGAAWHALFDSRDLPVGARVLNRYAWQELSFGGRAYRIKSSGTGKYQIDVAVDTTVFPGGLTWNNPAYNLRAILDPGDTPFPGDLRLGDRLVFSAVIYPLEGPRNPHEFDYRGYLASEDIYIQVGLRSIEQVRTPSQIFSWNEIRRKVLSAVDLNFSRQTAPLAKALLLGYKNELNRETRTAFSRAGLAHIMAVSGLHVGFILAPFWIVIPLFRAFRHGSKAGLLVLLATLFFYAGLTGFSPSVMRASLAGGLLTYGRLFHKVRNPHNLTAAAALVILLINPRDLFSISFQLSFGAVYTIFLVLPVVKRALPGWIRFRWYGTPVMAVVISFIVQMGLFPLLGYYFGEFSIAGPLANAFVIPFLGFIVPLALSLLPLALGWPGAARILNVPADCFLSGLGRFAAATASWEWSWMQVHIESAFLFMIWAAVILFIAALPIPQLRWKFLAALLLLLCVRQGQNLGSRFQSPALQVIFFDVGQGDAALLSTPRGKHYLLDTGRWRPDYKSAKYIIIPYLRGEGITRLDGIFLSHPHADHIGGMIALLNAIPVDTIYNSGSPYDSELYYNYHAVAGQKNIPVRPLRAGQRLMLDPVTRLFIYGPGDREPFPSNVNNRSLVLELVYGSTEFLFMGDAEREQERKLLRAYPRLVESDVLKVAHHGSRTSSAGLFLRAVNARIGIVSLDIHNRFNHPHETAVRRLRKHIDTLYFTSLDGAIQLISDGERILAAPEREY